MERIVKIALVIFIAGLFIFIGTYGAFFVYKERVCAVSLGGACYTTYPQYLKGFIGK